jgi:hypothetical protein
MNAAIRVNSPTVINVPRISSKIPAYQTGHGPVGTE